MNHSRNQTNDMYITLSLELDLALFHNMDKLYKLLLPLHFVSVRIVGARITARQ